MKALLWKDYRLNRTILLLGLIAAALPYVIVPLEEAYGRSKGLPSQSWLEVAGMAATYSLIFSPLLAVLLGGHAFAAERADRSSEFLAYLPVTRSRAAVAKFALAAAAVISVWGLGTIVRYATISNPAPDDLLLRIVVGTSVSMFGAAWLASAVMSSTGIPTMLGLLAPAAIMAVIAYQTRGQLDVDAGRSFAFWTLIQGSVCFALGTALYLKRDD